MKLAYVMEKGQGSLDRTLAEFANTLKQKGKSVAGVVQTNISNTRTHPCDMDLQVLPKGPIVSICQNLGTGSKGCRLDTDVLARAACSLEPQINRDLDLLIINKFGKLEAQGRGFTNIICLALDLNIPVLVGVNEMNFENFKAFSDGLAQKVAPKQLLDFYKCK